VPWELVYDRLCGERSPRSSARVEGTAAGARWRAFELANVDAMPLWAFAPVVLATTVSVWRRPWTPNHGVAVVGDADGAEPASRPPP
jgi:hypothetical protein